MNSLIFSCLMLLASLVLPRHGFPQSLQPGPSVGDFVRLPVLTNVGGITVEVGGQTALVTDGSGLIYRMDLTTGIVSEIDRVVSNDTVPGGIFTVLPGTQTAVIVARETTGETIGISKVDLSTGISTMISSSLLSSLIILGISPEVNANSVLIVGQQLGSYPRSGVLRVDLATGKITQLSSFGGAGITVEPGGATALVIENDIGLGVATGIYRVDLTSGAASLVLSSKEKQLSSLALDATANRVLFSHAGGLSSADLNTGFVMLLSSMPKVSNQLSLSDDGSFLLTLDGGYIHRFDFGNNSLTTLNSGLPNSAEGYWFTIASDKNLISVATEAFFNTSLTTGKVIRTKYSDSVIYSGIIGGITLEDSANTALVSTDGRGCFYGQLARLDLSLGSSTVVSSAVPIPQGIARANTNTAFVVGRDGCGSTIHGALYQVDLLTGTVKTTPLSISSPVAIEVEDSGTTALITSVLPSEGISRVDLLTGVGRPLFSGLSIPSSRGIAAETGGTVLVSSWSGLLRVDLTKGTAENLVPKFCLGSTNDYLEAVGIEAGGNTAIVSSSLCGIFRVRVNNLPSTPSLSISPPNLDFGILNVGASKTLDFSVQNTGGGTLTGSASATMPFSIVGDNSFSLAAGASKTITVRFSPGTLGSFNSNVSITSNAGNTLVGLSGGADNLGPPTITSLGDPAPPGSVISSLSPTFTWNAVPGATDYGLYIRDLTTNTLVYPYPGGTTIIPLTGTSFTLPTGYLVGGHSYRWAMTSFVGSTESAQSSYLYFQTPLAGPIPSISSVDPNPVPGSNSRQPFTVNGSNFVPGATVTLRDLSSGEFFPNRPVSAQSSTQIVINPNFTVAPHSWSVEIINPGGGSSGQFQFSVVSPDLIVENVTFDPATVMSGDTLTIGFDVRNIGSASPEISAKGPGVLIVDSLAAR